LTGDKPDAARIRAAISEIDRAAKRGVIHRNSAIRRKARLSKALAAK
jgi:ribosomal protein S20